MQTNHMKGNFNMEAKNPALTAYLEISFIWKPLFSLQNAFLVSPVPTPGLTKLILEQSGQLLFEGGIAKLSDSEDMAQ